MRRGVVGCVVALALAAPAGAARGEAVTGDGVIQSDERAAVKSVVPGAIRRLAGREGTVRSRGELLFQLENDLQRAQVVVAEAEVARAEAAVREAEVALASATREHARNQRVADLITEKELALSRDAVLNAEATLATRGQEVLRAREQLAAAREALALTTVTAPFDGVITRVYLREGDAPKPSETVVLDFLSLDRLYVEVALPLAYLQRVSARMPVVLDVEADQPAIRTTATGTVQFVYPDVDPVTRMFRVKVSVPRMDNRILPGLFARVRIDLPARSR